MQCNGTNAAPRASDGNGFDRAQRGCPMKFKFSRTTIFLIAWFAAILAAIAANDWWDDMQVEHKGMVVDATNGRPVEGAFVLAEYNESGGSWFGHASSWC